MAYHLPRVEHWIQNKNIYPYPTNIVRQVLTSPLSEYIIANFQILANTDAFSNLVQFASFIFILFSATLIFSIFKIGIKGQLFLLLALLSLPMLLFQATTTQTDLLASFFFISFILFALLIIQTEDNFNTNFIFLALSLTLGILTKYHIAIFAAPIVGYLLFYLIKKKNNKNTIFAVLISCLTITIILVPLFTRNIYFFGSSDFTILEINIIKRLGLNLDQIKYFSGDDKKLNFLYSKAYAFVFPSFYEGFGIPLLESMNMGCPIVCSNTSSFLEVANDAALFFDPHNSEDIKDKLEKIFYDKNLRKKLIDNGYSNIKKFSWEKCAQETLNVYKNLKK